MTGANAHFLCIHSCRIYREETFSCVPLSWPSDVKKGLENLKKKACSHWGVHFCFVLNILSTKAGVASGCDVSALATARCLAKGVSRGLFAHCVCIKFDIRQEIRIKYLSRNVFFSPTPCVLISQLASIRWMFSPSRADRGHHTEKCQWEGSVQFMRKWDSTYNIWQRSAPLHLTPSQPWRSYEGEAQGIKAQVQVWFTVHDTRREFGRATQNAADWTWKTA